MTENLTIYWQGVTAQRAGVQRDDNPYEGRPYWMRPDYAGGFNSNQIGEDILDRCDWFNGWDDSSSGNSGDPPCGCERVEVMDKEHAGRTTCAKEVQAAYEEQRAQAREDRIEGEDAFRSGHKRDANPHYAQKRTMWARWLSWDEGWATAEREKAENAHILLKCIDCGKKSWGTRRQVARDLRSGFRFLTCPHCNIGRVEEIRDDLTNAARDVLAERRRQVEAEGWMPEHDDAHSTGEMASAAACYATQGRYHFPHQGRPGPNWPWEPAWWKPGPYRQNLIKAGALILAEVERLDRAKMGEGGQ